MKDTSKATAARLEQANIDLERFVEYLKKNPGCTGYEISKKLSINPGKVSGIKKMMEGRLRSVAVVENNRVKKKLYLKD